MKRGLIQLQLTSLALLLSTAVTANAGLQATSKSKTAKTVKAEVKTADKAAKKTVPERDPFSYRSRSTGLIPVNSGSVPKGIAIKAILMMKNSTPLAVLKIPGYPQYFYVRENDVIRISIASGKKSKSSSGKNADIYLLVKKIGSFEVKIAQRRDPENLIIIR